VSVECRLCDEGVLANSKSAVLRSMEPRNRRSSGVSPLPSRSLPWSHFSLWFGLCQNPLVGLSKLVGKRRDDTFLDDCVAKLEPTKEEQRPNFKISGTLSISSEKPRSSRAICPCSQVLDRANFTPVVVYSWSCGFRFCKSGSVLLVSLYTVPLSSQSLVFRPKTGCGSPGWMILLTWYVAWIIVKRSWIINSCSSRLFFASLPLTG